MVESKAWNWSKASKLDIWKEPSIESYYLLNRWKKQMKKDKIQQYKDAEFFKKYVVAEDWEGFQKAMEASNIQDKELILRVLSMYSDPEVREREIKNIGR